MATRTFMGIDVRRLAIALAIVGLPAALPDPARAQFFDDRFQWGQRSYRPQPRPRDSYSFPFYNGNRNEWNRWGAPAAVESTKPPPPRKLDTPPTSTVMVIGDSLAEWLAYGLDETFTDSPDIGVVRKIRPTAGVIRLDAKTDTVDYAQAIKDILATDKPNAIVVMFGVNDRIPLRERAPPRPAPQATPQGQEKTGQEKAGQEKAGQEKAQGQEKEKEKEKTGQEKTQAAPPAAAQQDSEPPGTGIGPSYEFHTDKWAELYAKRIDEMIAVLKSKGVPILWVGMPSIKGAKTTSDMSYLDEIYRGSAEKAGIVYVDIWDGFVDESGRYVAQGPDFEGQTRRLRTGDGVHFTKAGAVKLAHYVEHELRRVISAHPMPVALPAPEEQGPAKPGAGGAGSRPVAGPVLPLTAATAAGGDISKDLLGAGSRPTQVSADPMATRVLGHGEPIAAPTGRADDFSWPRRSSGVDTEPDPVALTPAPPPLKGRIDQKKADDAKTKAAPDANAARSPRRSPRAELDGAPRPPGAAR